MSILVVGQVESSFNSSDKTNCSWYLDRILLELMCTGLTLGKNKHYHVNLYHHS